ncbi:MAG: 23S rRNA (pseudouridine(1915)-N(3))-methyltransferase RlmH [Bdellovibrionales bacterium]|nr:23S rRNA (pseudouridine(1915)-N(3))-methyltransferase RlmH [Bdellovibrionales bacterium]
MMQTQFGLAWFRRAAKNSFKHDAAHALFDEYRERISKFTPCEVSGIDRLLAQPPEPGTRVWVCDRGPKSKILSSEDVATQLKACLDGGVKKLWIVIGGPDGMAAADLAKLNPSLVWCFGKMTLPHELAAVVAAEQVYRAWSILRGLPYHGGH